MDMGVPNPLDWLPDSSWGSVQKLICINEFEQFATNMEKDAPARFKDWFNEVEPENSKLPLEWKRIDGTFDKLLVLRALRPDRITTALTSFISTALPNGNAYVNCDAENPFKVVLEQS